MLQHNSDLSQRFLGEVHVWSKLHHQNILAPLGLTTEFEQTVSVVSLWRGNARDYVQDKTVDPRPLVSWINLKEVLSICCADRGNCARNVLPP